MAHRAPTLMYAVAHAVAPTTKPRANRSLPLVLSFGFPLSFSGFWNRSVENGERHAIVTLHRTHLSATYPLSPIREVEKLCAEYGCTGPVQLYKCDEKTELAETYTNTPSLVSCETVVCVYLCIHSVYLRTENSRSIFGSIMDFGLFYVACCMLVFVPTATSHQCQRSTVYLLTALLYCTSGPGAGSRDGATPL